MSESQTAPPYVIYAVARILEYMEYSERKHFEQCTGKEKRDHIYHAVRTLRLWFDEDVDPEARNEAAIAKKWNEAASKRSC